MNGIALARWISSERPGLPVLLASGYSTQLAVAAEQGFTVLQKPVAPDSLVDAIRASLGRPVRG